RGSRGPARHAARCRLPGAQPNPAGPQGGDRTNRWGAGPPRGSIMTDHPTREIIDLLFAQSLTTEQEESLLAHIETCASCQDAYPEVLGGVPLLPAAAGPQPLSPTCRHLLERVKEIGPPDSMPALTDVDAPRPCLPGYEIEGVVGRGGMGV